MDELTLIGVSHRRGGAEALETYAIDHALRPLPERLAELGVSSWFELRTCNRVDVVLSRPEGIDVDRLRAAIAPANARRRPYAFVGEAALEQLARVAASLDALNPGEDQVMRQVRDAAQEARDAGRIDPTLSFAVDAALRVAKRVRREVPLAPRDASLFSLARGDVERVLAGGGRAVVVGAGEMGRIAARALTSVRGVALTIVNRDAERAAALARAVGGEARALADVVGHGLDAEVLVVAVAGGRLIDDAWLAGAPSLKLAVDLGIPRALDGRAARARGIELLDVDALQVTGEARRHALERHLASAEGLLREGIDEAMGAWAERSLAPSIRALQGWFEATLADALPAEEARRLARRVAHVPVKGLRAIARDHGLAAARTFLAETGLARPATVAATASAPTTGTEVVAPREVVER
ncbi:MAG: glutamyl-tRNA reductase [Trueperaceae bacterium]|nr:glutamyl-tRNA reductase [Trueperaceae bacterium]